MRANTISDQNPEKSYQSKLRQRTRMVTGIHNGLVLFLTLITMAISVGVGFLFYYLFLYLLQIPTNLWLTFFGLLLLVDVTYNISQFRNSIEEPKFKSIIWILIQLILLAFLFLIGNFYLVLRKVVWLSEEEQIYSVEILQFLYQQKQPENLGQLAKVVSEKKKKWEEELPPVRALEFAKKREQMGTQKLEIKLEEGKTAVMELDVATMEELNKITAALRGLVKLSYIEELVSSEKDLPFYKLTNAGEEFMMET